MATTLPPTLSSVTPEMAAALLQQLQQQNPDLIASIVGQQQQKGQQQLQQQATADPNRIPSPPKPQYNVSRREPLNRKTSSGSMGSGGRKTTPRTSAEDGGKEQQRQYKHTGISKTPSNESAQQSGSGAEVANGGSGFENKENGPEHDPVWVMRLVSPLNHN